VKTLPLQELAARIGGRVDGSGEVPIRGVAGIREARAGEISFIAQSRYLGYLPGSAASAVICGPEVDCDRPCIRVEDPYLAFLRAIEVFSEPVQEHFDEGIHPAAHIHPEAVLGEGVRVGAGAVVSRGCRVGAHTIIGPGVVLMPHVRVGERCLLYPNATVRESCELGDRVILHAGAVVGSDGFGYAKQGGSYHKIPQIGRVVVEDDVEIGANACVDRATTGCTVIGAGTKLDNLVQVAHNVVIGRHSVISAQTGISGSTRVGEEVMLAGQVGVVGHIEIGDRVKVGAQSGVSKSIPDDSDWFGSPARDVREAKRLQVHVNRLPRYAEEIAALKRRLEALERTQGAAPTTNP
jgi:UDP-3-O-[3-hydroxymyristoyl] glucosamine N-acyltransferase